MEEHAEFMKCSLEKCVIPGEALVYIAKNICADWRRVLRCLEVFQHIIDKTDEDAILKKWDSEERSYQGLLWWKRHQGNNASMCRLKHGLRKAERKDLADGLSRKLYLDSDDLISGTHKLFCWFTLITFLNTVKLS